MTARPTTALEKMHWNLLSLHRYWIYASKLRQLFLKSLSNAKLGKLKESELTELIFTDHIIYMSYWCSALYVVIEGYEDLSMHDDQIDKMLLDSRKDLLRRFRNGLFHYQ